MEVWKSIWYQTPPETFVGEKEFTMVTTVAGDNLVKQSYMGRQKGGKQPFF